MQLTVSPLGVWWRLLDRRSMRTSLLGCSAKLSACVTLQVTNDSATWVPVLMQVFPESCESCKTPGNAHAGFHDPVLMMSLCVYIAAVHKPGIVTVPMR